MKKIRKDVFENLVKATEKVFKLTESVEVENPENEIYVFTPSNILGVKNWNGKGNNKKVNVSLLFEELTEQHPTDLKAKINTYIPTILQFDNKWFSTDVSFLKKVEKDEINSEIENEITENLNKLKEENVLIEDVKTGYGRQHVSIIIDDNDTYKNTLENIKYLNKVIEAIEGIINEAVNKAIFKIQNKINERENEYQELKRLRKLARKDIVRTPDKLSKEGIIEILKKSELSQEQLKVIMTII